MRHSPKFFLPSRGLAPVLFAGTFLFAGTAGPAAAQEPRSPGFQPLFDPAPIGPLGAPSSVLSRVDRPAETGSTEPRKASRPTPPAQSRAQTTTRSASGNGGSDLSPGHSQRAGSAQRHGLASWYEHPGRTASGEVFKPDGLTAAHRTLPFGTRMRVSNPRNGRSVVVRINDRNTGPAKVAIDLSRGAARRLGITGIGTVTMSVLSDPNKERMAELEGAR